MIYTLGHEQQYDDLIASALGSEPPKKLGRCTLDTGEFYPGGTVWLTPRDAEVARTQLLADQRDDYAVYQLDATWWSNVESRDGAVGDLLHDAPIVAKVCFQPDPADTQHCDGSSI